MKLQRNFSSVDRKIFPITVVFFFFFCYQGLSQFSVSGTIRDKETGSPLAGAHVSVENTFISTASSEDGLYKIRIMKPGNYAMKISFMGYKPVLINCRLDRDTVIGISMETSAILGEEVNIIATRAQDKTPTTWSLLTHADIEKNNLGQDLPFILENTPSVVVTSDAGTGIGYTGINIRGSDLTRINVTLNGIPLNDAESQGVWFVDLPDLASSSGSIQVQRGVGTSTNGAGAFGASINVQTTPFRQDPYGELNSSAGSFNTFKNTLRFGTGLMGNKFAFDGRVSRITSDGYIDRAWSKLTAFSLSAGYYGKKTTLKFNLLSGYEKTYQAWLGVPKDSLATNRTYNPAGEYKDKSGNLAYYDNQTDNYTQTHYQLLFSQEINRDINLNTALHYTHGSGYYENYSPGQYFSAYNLNDVIIGPDTIRQTDLVNRKWIDNDFYGITFSGNFNHEEILKVTVGGAWNSYSGRHYGKVTWAEFASNGDNSTNWYYGTGLKNDFNIYAKANYQVFTRFNLFADLQYRYIYYRMEGTLEDLRTLDQLHRFNFFNPKAGIYYTISDKQDVYLSFAVANREPNRNNYEVSEPGNIPSPETVNDWELGYDLRLHDFRAGVNLYYMNYLNQLVLTGKINSVGEAVMTNVPHSYRTGIEITAGANVFKWLKWDITSTLSMNRIKDFTEYTEIYDTSWNLTGQQEQYLGKTDLSFSPGIILQNNFSFIPLKNLTLTLTSRYIGKQYIDNTSNRDRALNPYFVNNLTAGYSVKTKVIKEIGFNLAVNNLFSAKYETNAWVYPYYMEGKLNTSDGYFPQALISFLFGITLKI
ncbi:MAG: TonB-dependent receptor [Bacteroidetes bacterium]|nr:TonB-dependent receptor [Bacteroidota bacterium]